uniref:Plasmodium yoelii subtelomeric region (PYST-C1) n=1 Tax=Parastrongyloides trichosuri TaxID=131310 RepID=A0A0N4Z8J6_PARTI
MECQKYKSYTRRGSHKKKMSKWGDNEVIYDNNYNDYDYKINDNNYDKNSYYGDIYRKTLDTLNPKNGEARRLGYGGF